VLARALARRAADARRTGALAAFPDVVLDRVTVALLDVRGADHRRSADALGRWIGPVEPVDGAADAEASARAVYRALEEGRLEDAARAAADEVRALARRGHDRADPARWRRAVVRRLVLEDAGAAVRDGAPPAGRAFAAADDDADALAEAARVGARARVDLAGAERAARRAVTLVRRAEGSGGPRATVALAEVLLAAGRPGEAVDVLLPLDEPAGRGRDVPSVALALAEGLARTGRTRDADQRLARVLEAWPGLAPRLGVLPWVEDLASDGARRLLREARVRARRGVD
jgi:hypothetical protein